MYTPSPSQAPVNPPIDYHDPGPPTEQRWGLRPSTWFLLLWCFVLWPAVFATVVIVTLFSAGEYYDQPGGLLWPVLFWPLTGVLFSLTVGLPLALCAHRRRWYVRLIPTVIVAFPVFWVVFISGAGLWAIPGAATIALAIMTETFRLRLELLNWVRPARSRTT